MNKEESIKMIMDTFEYLGLDKYEDYPDSMEKLIQNVEDKGEFAVKVLGLLYKCKCEGMQHAFEDIIIMHHHIKKFYHEKG